MKVTVKPRTVYKFHPSGICSVDLAARSVPGAEVSDTSALAGLTEEATRTLVWSLLEWELPDVGKLEPEEGIPGADGRIRTFTYEGMPEENNDFGNKELILRFRDRPEWSYRQPVQFRYNRTGTGASALHHANMAHVNANDPNWYVYWQQVAKEFGFGPQARMMFHLVPRGNILGLYTRRLRAPNPEHNIANTEFEQIDIFPLNSMGIMRFITTIHHGNGHRWYAQLPENEGGWGLNITYYWRNDVEVEDLWEGPNATNQTRWNALHIIWNNGNDGIHKIFEVPNPDFDPNMNNRLLKDDMEHQGKILDFENEVENQENKIILRDWSITQ